MITRIKLDNFKIFKSQDFDIAPLTLITGINGMGKSSLIQSLLLLKQSFANTLLQSRAQVDLNSDFVNLESAEELCYEMAEDTNKKVTIKITYNNSENYEWVIDASKPKQKTLDCTFSGSNNLNLLSIFSNDFIYLDAERWGPREEYFRKERRVYNTKLGVQGELTPAYLANAITEVEQIGIKELRHESVSDSLGLYENLNGWMTEILGLPLKTKVEDINQDKLKLSYNIEGFVGQSHSALQVGFGVTFSLPIILAPLISKPGDLLIIENPEAHLHPSAQVNLGRLLALAAKNGVQIIIESHSDHILNSFRFSFKQGILNKDLLKIIFIHSGLKDNINIVSPDYVDVLERGKLSHRPAQFFDVWDKMLTKLL